jgi:hypothetical protein
VTAKPIWHAPVSSQHPSGHENSSQFPTSKVVSSPTISSGESFGWPGPPSVVKPT